MNPVKVRGYHNSCGDVHNGDDQIHNLDHPKKLRGQGVHVLVIYAGLEHKPLIPVLVLPEEPPESDESPPVDILGEPEVNYDEEDSELTGSEFGDELVENFLEVEQHHHNCLEKHVREESCCCVFGFHVHNIPLF